MIRILGFLILLGIAYATGVAVYRVTAADTTIDQADFDQDQSVTILDLTLMAQTGEYVVAAHDLGIIDGDHVYAHCFFPHAEGYSFHKGPDNPWTVTLAAAAKNVTLEVLVMPDSMQGQRAHCPQEDWTVQ